MSLKWTPESERDDAAVLGCITDKPIRNSAMIDGLDMRRRDRALQRLRKRGLIRNIKGGGGGWVRSDAK